MSTMSMMTSRVRCGWPVAPAIWGLGSPHSTFRGHGRLGAPDPIRRAEKCKQNARTSNTRKRVFARFSDEKFTLVKMRFLHLFGRPIFRVRNHEISRSKKPRTQDVFFDKQSSGFAESTLKDHSKVKGKKKLKKCVNFSSWTKKKRSFLWQNKLTK